jgi:hypothetical protein
MGGRYRPDRPESANIQQVSQNRERQTPRGAIEQDGNQDHVLLRRMEAVAMGKNKGNLGFTGMMKECR